MTWPLFEHLGWESIRNLSDDTKAACDAAIYLTVSAGSSYITNDWGEGIGMDLIWSGITMYSPFRFSVKSSEGRIRVNTTFDGNLLSIETMDKILRQFEQAIFQIIEFDGEKTLEDVHLDADWGEVSILIPAVEAKSIEDLRFAVQKIGYKSSEMSFIVTVSTNSSTHISVLIKSFSLNLA
ncbi:hypothetical protein EYC84_000358 [Monilinia fructicola]|uniref:Uncharacterized protein n=1 Tax=Monilinia fructicola TaxID=38448 RepID=A0A5M9JQL3_MONFR|nr:hypothetical protein EYC84_000358 [Monilinia fructicola]